VRLAGVAARATGAEATGKPQDLQLCASKGTDVMLYSLVSGTVRFTTGVLGLQAGLTEGNRSTSDYEFGLSNPIVTMHHGNLES